MLCIFSYILSIFSSLPSTSHAVKVVTLESFVKYNGIASFAGLLPPLLDLLGVVTKTESGVAALTGCVVSDFTGIGRKEGVLGQAGGFMASSLEVEAWDNGMEPVALLIVSPRLRTAGGGPMDPSPDFLLGVLELLDLGLLGWPLVKDSNFRPPNLVVMETSLRLGFLGGAKMEV